MVTNIIGNLRVVDYENEIIKVMGLLVYRA